MSRNEQLKEIFAMALDLAIGFHPSAFAGVDVERLKPSLRHDMMKFEITNALEAAGVSNPSHIAQVILAVGNSLDR